MYSSRYALLDIFESILKFEKYSLKLFDIIKEAWQRRNEEEESEGGSVEETRSWIQKVQKHAQALLDKQQRIT
jgi:hypothetical protein